MHKHFVLLLVVVAPLAYGTPFSVLCDIHPVANDKYQLSRVYQIDPERQTFEGYRAVFTETTVTVEKPFLENTPFRNTPATYTLNRLDGKLDISSRLVGVAPFIGSCRKAPLPLF